MSSTTPACPQCGNAHAISWRLKLSGDQGAEGLIQCPSCQLISRFPYPSRERLSEQYGTGHGNWVLLDDQEVRIPNRRRRAKIEALHGGRPGALYEVGASTGQFLSEMHQAGWQVQGIEPAPEAVKVAQEHFGLVIEQGFFPPPGGGHEDHDVVVCWDVLEHVPAPDHFLEEMWSFLRPGGVLALSVPAIDGLPARLFGERWRFLMPTVHINFCPIGWFEQQLAGLGARDIRLEGFAKVQS